MMVAVTDDEYDRICDVADNISGDVWAALQGHDLSTAMIVVGTLLANVERSLAPHGWDRDRVLDEVCEIADACDAEQVGGRA